MDVCRMTQAYRQQHPGMRHANKRTTSSPSSGLTVSASHTDDHTVSPTPATMAHHREQQSSVPASPTTPTSPGFSITSMLPASLASALSSAHAPSASSGVAASALLPGLNMGELEAQSLLLRSMPMFGSLISRD